MGQAETNEGTRVSDVRASREARPVGVQAAWALARARLAARLGVDAWQWRMGVVVADARLPPGAWQVALVRTRDAAEGAAAGDAVRDLPLALTLGRHTACAAPLPAGSLRQVVVMAWPGEDGELWALDLNTETRLVVGNEDVSRVHARRTLGFMAGGATVIAFLLAPGQSMRDLPDPGAPVSVSQEGRAAPEMGAPGPEDGRMTAVRRRPGEASFARFLERLKRGADEQRQGFPAPDGTFRSLTGNILDPGTWAELEPDARELEEGVLLGRYARCVDNALIRAGDSVSRVHALLLRHAGRTYAVDLASTHGTGVERPGQPPVELWALGAVAELRSGDVVAVSPSVRVKVVF